ncbi:MAG TPA: hypothetical protein VM537_36565, partial [Anaerolineae bacterium]|nr:hypothetical protein [Anaerolineae bacterium]
AGCPVVSGRLAAGPSAGRGIEMMDEEERWTWRVVVVVLIAGLVIVGQAYVRGPFWPAHREALRALVAAVIGG